MDKRHWTRIMVIPTLILYQRYDFCQHFISEYIWESAGEWFHPMCFFFSFFFNLGTGVKTVWWWCVWGMWNGIMNKPEVRLYETDGR